MELFLLLFCAVLGLCPPRWIPYKEELCLYVADGPALSWSEARIFCQDQRAELVVIKNYNKQMFLTGLIDGARRRASHYWIGLMWQETKAQLTWVDATPISQSWYSNWLRGHPKKGRCVQLVGFYTSQWRDWDCSANSSFICEIPARDAFPGSVRKVRFSSYCYAFHFPSFREVRSWREAQALCQESGDNLVTIRNEEDNAFLSYAFPVDGWYMWIGLRFGTAWKWSDFSFPVYFRWHPDEAPTKTLDQCAVLSLQPDDVARHGTWKTRSCNAHPTSEATGFICQHKHDFCGPPEPVEFPLPGGMGPYTTADVVFSLPAQSSCSLSLIGWYAYTTPFQLSLVSDATHVHGSIMAELGNISVYKNFPHVPFSPGLNSWSFITFPDGIASFFNHWEHFRLSDAQDISFANLSSLRMSGVTVANASLEYRFSYDLHFPGGSSLQLENAISRYLGNFTIGLWVRSSFTLSPKMCLISYSLKWRPLEFALFLLSPSGLEFHVKGAVMFSGTSVCLLDGSWHHVAVAVSSIPGVIPFQVFVDGEAWEPDYADGTSFLHKGLSLGGKLSVGQLEVDSRGTRFYVGDLSEANLWDQVLSELSVKQLAASKTKWKYPGNVVSWNQLLAKRPVTVQISTPSEDPDAAFVWFGLLRLRGRSSVLCTDPESSRVYIEPMPELCLKHAFWGLQLNGRVRNIADPSSCLLVAPDGVSLLSNSNCSTDAKSSFRLLPDQRLQNLNSGFCLFQEVISSKLYLQKCTSEALYFALDWDVHCPQSRQWRARKDKCFFFVLNVALKWQQALKFCQRFLGGSLVMLNSLQEQAWLKNELPVSVWTGLHSSVEGSLSWANGTPLNKALQRFIFTPGASNMISCMLALTSGFLKAESCQRPHRWICQTSRQSDLYMMFPGKSFYGAWTADVTFSLLSAAKQQCSSLGRGCNMVVSTAAGHRLGVGTRFATLEETAADPVAAVHVKSKCFPGYSGEDCQSMCPHCEPGVSCNPLTGLCDGFLYYREMLAVYTSLKCLPFGNWVFEHGSCVTLERYSSQEEAESICKRYLGAEVWKAQNPLHMVPMGFSGAERRVLETKDFLWACQRPEDVELLSFKEKLLISLQDAPSPQKRASLQEATDACYLHKEHCTGVLSLHGAYYMVAGTVLVDFRGSGAILYVKSACSAGFCGDKCQKRCPPTCLSRRIYNPLTGQCDGLLSCVRQFSPSCLHGLVSSRCPHNPGWWFWDGHCYYVEEHSSKSWKGAKAACEAYGKDVGLLTLTSAKEKAWIMAMVQKESWTGLNDVDKDGTWMWAEGQAADFSPSWLADVQLMLGGCLGIGPQGEQNLAVSSCSELKPWVCKATVLPQSSCPTEPGWRPWNGSCYFRDSSLASGWHEALQVCQRFRKTELLYLTSLQEKEWVSSNFGGSFWTGLNDVKDESIFRWTTQEEPLSQPLAQYLHDDMADGGLKDCVWFDTATGFLIDASCKEKRPFLCKCSEATDWFDKQSGRGAAGDLELLYPSMESLEQAKQECLLERTACVAVLQTDKGFYLISSMEDIISKPDSTLYTWSICAKGFSGPRCHKALTPPPHPACDYSGRFQTTAKKGKEGERERQQADGRQAVLEVCGIPVQSCVDDCRHMTTWKNCLLCLPACTEANLSSLDPEELALITMIQFRVSHSLSLTAEDERDRGNSSKIIYDSRYP